MGKEILMLRNSESEKSKFYCHKKICFLEDVDVEKVLVSNKLSFT